MTSFKSKYLVWRFFVAMIMLSTMQTDMAVANGDFEKYEVRVIRPRFMNKKKRFELGGQISVIMNQSFIYSYLATGLLTFHFSETFAFELATAFGISIDKEDKRVLDSEFDIQTQILRTQSFVEGSVLWTPIYGKYQLSSGKLIYFDTYLTFGAGMTGIYQNYEHCVPASEQTGDQPAVAPPSETVYNYPTFVIGLGQKFFLSRKTALRWDIRDHIMSYSTKDTACDPENDPGDSVTYQNVTLQIGASRFF